MESRYPRDIDTMFALGPHDVTDDGDAFRYHQIKEQQSKDKEEKERKEKEEKEKK